MQKAKQLKMTLPSWAEIRRSDAGTRIGKSER
jgi:hypothetical protein